MRFLFALAAFFIWNNSLFSQDEGGNESSHLKDFARTLTPSPSVASLGSYGGIDLHKSTGGISKSIPLFGVAQREFVYQPSIDYFSTGVKVDDWGSRVGIGWTEKLTAVITRTVKGIPDDK